MKSKFLFSLFCLLYSVHTVAAELSVGAKIADERCASCHGNKGTGRLDEFPNLKGQKLKYLIKELLAFQNGTRKDPVMEAITQSLSKEEISEVANHYSKQ